VQPAVAVDGDAAGVVRVVDIGRGELGGRQIPSAAAGRPTSDEQAAVSAIVRGELEPTDRRDGAVLEWHVVDVGVGAAVVVCEQVAIGDGLNSQIVEIVLRFR
jgi:hypothetical protein